MELIRPDHVVCSIGFISNQSIVTAFKSAGRRICSLPNIRHLQSSKISFYSQLSFQADGSSMGKKIMKTQ